VVADKQKPSVHTPCSHSQRDVKFFCKNIYKRHALPKKNTPLNVT
jgi:hypothetical protein